MSSERDLRALRSVAGRVEDDGLKQEIKTLVETWEARKVEVPAEGQDKLQAGRGWIRAAHAIRKAMADVRDPELAQRAARIIAVWTEQGLSLGATLDDAEPSPPRVGMVAGKKAPPTTQPIVRRLPPRAQPAQIAHMKGIPTRVLDPLSASRPRTRTPDSRSVLREPKDTRVVRGG